MTQARARAHGVVTPSLSQHLLTAMLRVLVDLVQGVASTLQMIFTRRLRDWHTEATQEALPRETSDISETGTNIGPPGSRPAVDAQRRTSTLHDHAFTSEACSENTRSRRRPLSYAHIFLDYEEGV